jgi:hypothetical protein
LSYKLNSGGVVKAGKGGNPMNKDYSPNRSPRFYEEASGEKVEESVE